jgi:hypothetical protein
MSTRAKWTEGILDLYADLETAATYHTTEQVSDLTGFSAKTITDLLSRKPISKGTNPQGPLSRPAARIGTKPLYSTAQIEDVLRRRKAQIGGRYLGGQNQPLPKISFEEAQRRHLISVTEIAYLADVHEQTVRKWASRDADFPAAEATRDRSSGHSGVPFVVRPHKAVERWLINKGKITADEAAARWTAIKGAELKGEPLTV